MPLPPLPGPGDALFLDFDGTLVEIAEHPDAIAVDPGLCALLAAVAKRLEGRLAIISGRAIAQLDTHLPGVALAMAGSHGGEFRPSGAADPMAFAEPLPPSFLDAMKALARAHGGLLVEAKPFSAAIHYRNQPAARDVVLAAMQDLAATDGLALKHGKMVVEAVMPGSDKGSALVRFMGLPEFAGARPLFAGDDVTDEDAFRAVSRRHGGAFDGGGILVGPMRDTAAVWHLGGVAAVHAWLEAVAGGARA